MNDMLHILKNIGAEDLQIINEVAHPIAKTLKGDINNKKIFLNSKKFENIRLEDLSIGEIIKLFIKNSIIDFKNNLINLVQEINRNNSNTPLIFEGLITNDFCKDIIEKLIKQNENFNGVSRDKSEIFIKKYLLPQLFLNDVTSFEVTQEAARLSPEAKAQREIEKQKKKEEAKIKKAKEKEESEAYKAELKRQKSDANKTLSALLKKNKLKISIFENELDNVKRSLSFACTLKLRLIKQFGLNGEKNNFNSYLQQMFEPNAKIENTATKLNPEQIKTYIDFINRNSKTKITNYPENAKAFQFTLPALESQLGINTCTSKGACAAFCYASAGTYEFTSSIFKSEFSLIFSLSKQFVPEVVHYLKSHTADPNTFYFVRIHDSGDFYSRVYFRKWATIAHQLPHVLFYGYTKQVGLLVRNLPPNFKFSQSFGGRNDNTLNKFFDLKDKLNRINNSVPQNKGSLSAFFNKIIDRFSLSNLKKKVSEKEAFEIEKEKIKKMYHLNDRVFDRLMDRLTISKVFKSVEEFEEQKKKTPGVKWILVNDDDVAALDVGLSGSSPIGIALIVHGAKSGKLK